ncbi:MAG TPA: tRNA lysidine(34) synthetase TilS [Candidatus Cybelea sp.]
MRGTHAERAVERAIRNSGAIVPGESLLVACSGGPDSVALAAALNVQAHSLRLRLRLAYVNHGVRASALQDECVVASLGAACGLAVDIVRLTAEASDESSLRDARYAALSDLARREDCGVVATAHHAEDQTETVLLALFRGSGPDGLFGMPARRALGEGVSLARPLLHIAADTLRDACHAHALPYAVDATNADFELRRNAVRGALAALRPLFPGLDEAVARAATLTGEEARSTRKAELRRRVRACLAEQEELRDVAFTHVEAAVRALEAGRSGSFWMKPGLRLEIQSGVVAGITRSS